MTFDEARTKHLSELDNLYAKLYSVVKDRSWNNTDYREYKDTLNAFAKRLERIRELNSAEMESQP